MEHGLQLPSLGQVSCSYGRLRPNVMTAVRPANLPRDNVVIGPTRKVGGKSMFPLPGHMGPSRREADLASQNTPLRHENYCRLFIFKKQQIQEKLWKPRDVPFLK